MSAQKRFLSMTMLIAVGTLAGCATDSSPPPLTESQKQDAILKDPWSYKPQVGGDNSGGDISSFDRNGFNKDLNDLLGP